MNLKIAVLGDVVLVVLKWLFNSDCMVFGGYGVVNGELGSMADVVKLVYISGPKLFVKFLPRV
jgi:hypothetical protein